MMPERCLPNHPVLPSEGSRNGIHYLAAGGARIPNRGEMKLSFLTKERHQCRIAFQVAEVKRPLLAVSTRTRAGNDVTFGPHGGKITNRTTRRTIEFVKRDGIYVLEILVAPAPKDSTQVGRGFTRQGAAA